jgi:glycine cleavage system H protein
LKIKSYDVPEDLLYTKEHEWARIQGQVVVVGITEYAAKTLNDIVYVSLPSLGQILQQLASFGTVESIKAVSELYSPCSGAVSRVNSELRTHPELINQSPYGNGWLVEISSKNFEVEKRNLLNAAEYARYLNSLK